LARGGSKPFSDNWRKGYRGVSKLGKGGGGGGGAVFLQFREKGKLLLEADQKKRVFLGLRSMRGGNRSLHVTEGKGGKGSKGAL